jgi:hypothetical protein
MRRRALPAAVLLLAAVISTVPASEPEAEAAATGARAVMEVSPREGTVGDLLEVTLEVVTPQGFVVDRPQLGPVGSFTFRERTWEGPLESGEELRWIWRGSVAAFETGELELPGAVVQITGPDGAATVRSEPVDLTIRTVIVEGESGEDLADLKSPASIPPDYSALRTAAVVLLALLGVSLVAWWLHRRWAHRLAAVPAPEDPFHRMPPHEWVYKELQHLLERRLAEEGEIDSFFSELSRILKTYLGGRYRVDLMERTTAEVPDDLRGAGAPRESIPPTRTLLERADRVKFAGDRPDPTQCREAVEAVYGIVDVTRPATAVGDAERGAA